MSIPLVTTGTVERYTLMGVRAVTTYFLPWIQAGLKELVERAAARRPWLKAPRNR
jgi:hypothetical protein